MQECEDSIEGAAEFAPNPSKPGDVVFDEFIFSEVILENFSFTDPYCARWTTSGECDACYPEDSSTQEEGYDKNAYFMKSPETDKCTPLDPQFNREGLFQTPQASYGQNQNSMIRACILYYFPLEVAQGGGTGGGDTGGGGTGGGGAGGGGTGGGGTGGGGPGGGGPSRLLVKQASSPPNYDQLTCLGCAGGFHSVESSTFDEEAYKYSICDGEPDSTMNLGTPTTECLVSEPQLYPEYLFDDTIKPRSVFSLNSEEDIICIEADDEFHFQTYTASQQSNLVLCRY